MDIRLDNIACATALSQGSLAFTADLIIDGVCVGQAYNRGDGGDNVIDLRESGVERFRAAQRYVAQLPEIDFGVNRCKPTMGNLITQCVKIHEAWRQVRRQTEQWCGPDSATIAIFRRDTGKMNVYDLPMGERVEYGGGECPAQAAILDKERAEGHDPILLNELYATDADQAAEYTAMACNDAVYWMLKWTLQDALARARLQA